MTRQKWNGSLFALILLGSTGLAQGPVQGTVGPVVPVPTAGEVAYPLPDDDGPSGFTSGRPERRQDSFLTTLSQAAIVVVDSLSRSCSGVNLSTSHHWKPGGH